MLLEDVILILIFAAAGILIGHSGWKLILSFQNKKPLRVAKDRFEKARLDLEVSKLEKEIDHVYEQIYNSALEEDKKENKNGK